MEFFEGEFNDESETDAESSDDSQDYPSDDSQEDPNFEVFEETQKNLSIRRRPRRLKAESMNEKEDEGEHSEQDIITIVNSGNVDCLKVEECKIYLRKYGLRLSGSKETLIQRIKEHSNIINGGGEKKYPASSFVMNCKGDACMGDVVMFKQRVYRESGASRSVKVGPCGIRVVAGRIVTESYGAARQQHTFTIEVLWSRGVKPLPPLRPLLIKGRNLYRLRTMRQKWEDEGERQKILLEKHARGSAARLKRKMERQTRPTRNQHSNGKQNEKRRGHLRNVDVKPHNQQFIHQQAGYTTSQSANVYSSNGPTRESYNERVNDFVVRSPILGLPLTGFPNSNFRGGSSMLGPTWERYNERHANFRTVQSRVQGHGPTVFPSSNHRGGSALKSPLHPYSQ